MSSANSIMNMKMTGGIAAILLGSVVFFICKETIRELSGIGASSGPPPSYEVGSSEFWEHELSYYWWVRPFLPDRLDITKTLKYTQGTDDISQIKKEYYKRNLGSSNYLRVSQYFAVGLVASGIAYLAACFRERIKKAEQEP